MFKRSSILLPLAAALFVGACSDSTGSNGGAPRLTIQLHDAPGDLKEAWVKVDRIYLQGSESADSTAGRVDLLTTQTGWMNLTQLTGSNIATLVNNATVPAGTYTQLRFIVCDAYVVTNTGQVYATPGATLPAGVTATGTLRLNSQCQSGFKVNLPDGAVTLANSSTILSVDFDVSQSFGHQAGASGQWVMHPVLTATAVGFSGTISGTVSLGTGVTLPTCGGSAITLASFTPTATNGTTVLTGTVTAGGTFSITAAPGTYTMGSTPAYSLTNGDSLFLTAAPSVATAAVTAGNNTTVNYTISAATCKPHA
jgi:uncharacterized protein DUF4382